MVAMKSTCSDPQLQLQAAFTEICIHKTITRLQELEPEQSLAVPVGLTAYWDNYFRNQPLLPPRSLSPTPSEPDACSNSSQKQQRSRSNNQNKRKGSRGKPPAAQSQVQKRPKKRPTKMRRSHIMITRRRVTCDTKFYHLDKLPS